MAIKQTFFKLCWTKHPNYSFWIAAVKDNNKRTRCTNCNTTFNILGIGQQALRSHIKGKKYSQKVAPAQCFFKIRKVKESIAGSKTGEPETNPPRRNCYFIIKETRYLNFQKFFQG